MQSAAIGQSHLGETSLGKFDLREFCEATVVFKQGASVPQVLARCHQEACSLTVMIDRQGQPLGLLSLHQLLHYCDPWSKSDKTSTTKSNATKSNAAKTGSTPKLDHPPSSARPPIIKRAWLTDLPRFPTELPWQEGIAQLLTVPDFRYWAWLDPQGQWQGLIDRTQVLRWWKRSPLNPLNQSRNPAMEQGGLQEAWGGMGGAGEWNRDQGWLLDQVPMPILIYDSQGQVLYQNAIWQQLGLDSEPILSGHVLLHEFPNLNLRYPVAAPAIAPKTIAPKKSESPPATTQRKSTSPGDPIWQFFQCPLSLDTGSQGGVAHRQVSPSASLSNMQVASASPIAPSGSWLVIAQDLGERQRLEQELVAKNADLLQLNRLKDEFLACISHELRSPLTSVLGLSSLLQDPALGALNERQARYAQLIYRSGKHLMGIVNDILDLTRIETGQLELTWATVTIAEVCQSAFEQAQQVRWMEEKPNPETGSDRSGPTFSLEIEPALQTLIADGTRLKQMLVNLLSNALKFTDVKGRVGLQVAHWEGWIAFTVWDTGIGIPADKQHLIFQKFQQLENPMTRQFEGTGLGLVLTQRLARLHGGDVTFISRENQGSQFTLLLPPEPATLPRRGEEERPQTASRPETPRGGNRMVLVVETSVRNLEDVVDQLTDLDYRAIVARSGTEALEKARKLQPCAILLTPFLPLLSGWDVLTLLKSDAQTGEIPVIVTATQSEQAQAHRHGADGFLGLPISHRALAQTLDRLTQPVPRVIRSIDPETSSARVLLCLHVQDAGSTVQGSDGVSFESLADPQSTDPQSTDPQPCWELSSWLHGQNYRMIESDDLEQAELLARVWQPQVVLLQGYLRDPLPYLKALSRQTYLASLPLITFDVGMTQAANQIPGLAVFPYLALPTLLPTVWTETAPASPVNLRSLPRSPSDAPSASVSPSRSFQSSPTKPMDGADLLQVIDVAISFAGRPYILAIGGELLQAGGHLSVSTDPERSSFERSNAGRSTEAKHPSSQWLQALIQYLQTAGLRGSISTTPTEVQQKLQSHNVHLLVIDWQRSPSEQELRTSFQTLQAMIAMEPDSDAHSGNDSDSDRIMPLDRPTSLPPILLITPKLAGSCHASICPDSASASASLGTGGVCFQEVKDQEFKDLQLRHMFHECSMHQLLAEIHHLLGINA
ncbi:MAG: hybrid sensor histidine kinase/response regulator [Synechococcales bacterium]|nr:hybrid sensor histidine kinase/response regulator [Synechococcales bacterium]